MSIILCRMIHIAKLGKYLVRNVILDRKLLSYVPAAGSHQILCCMPAVLVSFFLTLQNTNVVVVQPQTATTTTVYRTSNSDYAMGAIIFSVVVTICLFSGGCWYAVICSAIAIAFAANVSNYFILYTEYNKYCCIMRSFDGIYDIFIFKT